MTKILSITKAREDLTKIVDRANRLLEEYIITVNGSPAAVIVSAAEYASLKETDEILADKQLMKAIKQGEKDIKQGRYVTFEQLKKELKLNV
jgi:prevent-host-death family protein